MLALNWFLNMQRMCIFSIGAVTMAFLVGAKGPDCNDNYFLATSSDSSLLVPNTEKMGANIREYTTSQTR